ncbi:MAG: hypothetical protein EHM68_10880 [Lysobacterales bacterium]|nr:MAG: hypothetical protein EHM68_10880 [Xanthomonadales bacterium]
MFSQFLPQRIDNAYRGHRLALWLFGAVVFMKTSIGLGTIFNGRTAAISADAIPLETFPPAAAQAFLSVFAIWGFAQVMIGLLCILALVRYRAMVPFMFALLLLEHLGRKLILYYMPIAKTGTPPGLFINLALVAAMIVGLVLALRTENHAQALR